MFLKKLAFNPRWFKSSGHLDMLVTRWFKSIGWKLALWYMALFLVLSLVLSFLLYQRLKFQLYEEVDFFLADEMNEFSQFVSEHQNNLSLIERQIQLESVAIRKYYQMYYSILDKSGRVVLQSSEFQLSGPDVNMVKSSVLPNYDVKEYEVTDKKSRYVVRIITKQFQNQNEFISHLQVGMNLTRIEKTMSNFRKNILMTLPAFFLLSFIGGLLLARHNLRPISQMINTVSRITAANLKEKVPLRGSEDELDKLAYVFNNMIERVSQAYEKLSQFSSDVAHELRTPLTSLTGEIEAVLSNEKSYEECRAVLMSNLEEISRLECLVNNLLFLSKNDDPSQVKEAEIVDLNAVILDVAEIFEPVADEKQIGFSKDIIPTPLYIQGEKWQIEQMISNLLDNSIRYNRFGGSVVISLKKSGDCAEIDIKDTGIGISDENKEKVFDRFYREDSSRTRDIGGFGLGLSIVKSIIEAHAGRISVSSQLGKSSTFTVKLPLQQKSSTVPS
ncbi:MAG: heavy metal sensor histidine kinase [Candidatus Omnitrophica bacterium]|nr:heavy metal sensor histidine kinase [Candidatus Omnitrophota bacterium]